jgi:hypothetical protein
MQDSMRLEFSVPFLESLDGKHQSFTGAVPKSPNASYVRAGPAGPHHAQALRGRAAVVRRACASGARAAIRRRARMRGGG